MSTSQPPPLPDDIAGLLGAERAAPQDPGTAARAAVWARLSRSLELAPPPAPAPHALPPAGMKFLGALAAKKTAVGLALALAAGGAAVSGVRLAEHAQSRSRAGTVTATRGVSALASPAVPVPARAAPVAAPDNTSPTGVIPIEAPPTAPVAAAARPTEARAARTVVAEPDAVERDEALRAERRVLEAARTALQGGDAPGALAQLAAHRAQFQSATLREERDALEVEALARAGRGDDARVHAARFARTFPRSIYRAAIERSLGGPP